MKNHRLGAWIGQETRVDSRTGRRVKNSTWSVKYRPFDATPGDYRTKRERGFATRDAAITWWMLQKQNQHRPVRKAEAVKAAPLTLTEFSKRWLASIASTVTTGARSTYIKHVEHWIVPSLGDVLLPDLERQPELIELAQARWLTAPRRDHRKGCVTPGYVKSIRNTLTTILNRAKRLRLISINPTEVVDQVRAPRNEMRALGSADVQAYLAAFDHTELGCAVAVAIGSGCRRGELLALRWCDLDLDAGTLRVARSLERVTIKTANGAAMNCGSRNPRRSTHAAPSRYPRFAIERLRRHRLEQAERFISAGARPDADTLLFERDGEPWNPNTFGLTVRPHRRDAKLPHVRLHDLRHSFASFAARRRGRPQDRFDRARALDDQRDCRHVRARFARHAARRGRSAGAHRGVRRKRAARSDANPQRQAISPFRVVPSRS